MSEPPLLTVTLGRCDEMRAEVYVRVSGEVPPATRLGGTITGPCRRHDETLQAAVRLDQLPDLAGAGPVARALLTEPAYWTPESPNLYRLEARLEQPSCEPWSGESRVGLRRFGVRSRSFWLDGRRWVPRVVTGPTDVAEARKAAVGIVTAAPCGHLLAEADELGVAVVILLEPSEVTPERIGMLARHPSALMAVVVGHGQPESLVSRAAAARPAKGTMQIGVAVEASMPAPVVADVFDFVAVVLRTEGVPNEAWRSPPDRPLVAWRICERVDTPAARAVCDTLQRDLAAWGLAVGGDRLTWDWAGYFVGGARETPDSQSAASVAAEGVHCGHDRP